MATEVILPRQGNTVETCLILGWKKKEGDTIAAGEVLCEVETDKAVVESPAPVGGVILYLGGEPGDVLAVDELLAVIGEEGETWSRQEQPDHAGAGEDLDEVA